MTQSMDGSSENTSALELRSLILDVKTLQRVRDEDKQEFSEFSEKVKKNFISIQENFDNIQASLVKLLAAASPQEPPASPPPLVNASATDSPAQGSVNQELAKAKVTMVKPIGTSTLHDHTGKELNLDGSERIPYRHPNSAVPQPQLLHNRSEAKKQLAIQQPRNETQVQ